MYKHNLLLLLLLLSLGASAQPSDKFKRLDSFFTILGKANKFMGVISIGNHDTIIYTRSVGHYKLTNDTAHFKNSTNTLFRIGSVSKMFTATMILQLIEEGKLELHTPLARFFPEVPNAKEITIEMLLNQRSGLFDFTKDSTYPKWFFKPMAQKEMVSLIASHTPKLSPGIKASYSSTNYVLLGYILEKISQRSYKEELESRIIRKLDLKNTKLGAANSGAKEEAYSYAFSKDAWNRGAETDPSVGAGAAAIVSTSEDLIVFINALFKGKIISNNSLEKMLPITDAPGLGLSKFRFSNSSFYGDIGIIDRYNSGVCYFPMEGLSLSFTTNGLNIPANDLLIPALRILFDQPFRLPAYDITLSDQEMATLEGTYSYTSNGSNLKMVIKKGRYGLQAQFAGQPAFSLEALTRTRFQFTPAAVVIDFPRENAMTLNHKDVIYEFIKEKQ